jgi:hypothetical protein
LITYLLDGQAKEVEERQTIRQSLGWWGRGFIEGSAYIIDLPGNEQKAMKKVLEFGVSNAIVVAHIDTYCRAHPTDTPIDGVQNLLTKMLK